MMDSLPYRNDAAIVLGRLMRSLPTRRARDRRRDVRQGPARDADGAGRRATISPPSLVPGGVTLPPTDGVDAGAVQTIGARFAYGQMSLEEAAELGCRACASPGGGCQFLGTAATSQVVAEALGLTVPHAALAPSGQPIWLDVARRSARAAVGHGARAASTTRDILTDAADPERDGRARRVRRLDESAAAHSGDRARGRAATPTVDDWLAVNRQVPRLVDVLPNGPHPTVRVFLAGGVPEVMLHLRARGLLDSNALHGRPARRWARCSTGGSSRTPRARCVNGCARRTASIPTT